MDEDLKWIKNKYGEKMRDICRREFPTILEFEGLLPSVLDKYFYNYRYLAHDIEGQDKVQEFKHFILSNVELKEEEITVEDSMLSAVELFDRAGYILYPECQTEEDIQSFRHYYYRSDGIIPVYKKGEAPLMYAGEELCTFNGSRLRSCRVWFAVKKNVDEIKREDFKNPERQDEYGTSVISIQFTKGSYSTLSIKNRYNHSVKNPDNTFNSKLDNIILGLANAFERDYGVKDTNSRIRSDFELNHYVYANDGRMYPYNMEICNVYYCPDNIIIDNFYVKKLNTNHQVLIDYFIVDTQDGSIRLYDRSIRDSFVERLNVKKKIFLGKEEIIFKMEDGSCVNLKFNKRKEIIGLEDLTLENCGPSFLQYNKSIEKVNLPNLKNIGQGFLYDNYRLQELNLPLVQSYDNNFLCRNLYLRTLSMPSLQKCGDNFLSSNVYLEEINLPNLVQCGEQFLYSNLGLTELCLPKLTNCGRDFLYSNRAIKEVNLPMLQKCNDNFMLVLLVKELNLPRLEECGRNFLGHNNCLVKVNLPQLKKCGVAFLCFNNSLTELSLPALKECEDRFLFFNNSLVELNLPNLIKCGNRFLHYNDRIKKVDLTSLSQCGEEFLAYNNSLEELSLPNLNSVESKFMTWNTSLSKIFIPNLQNYDNTFLLSNSTVKKIKKLVKFNIFSKFKDLIVQKQKGNDEQKEF